MIKNKRFKILFWFFTGILVVSLLCLFTDFYRFLLPPLDVGQEIDENYGDVILVFGGGMKKGRTLGYSTEERLQLAADLFIQKKRPIIISEGSVYKGSPAIKMVKDFFRERGVGEEYLKFEGKSQTTYDNCFYAQKVIEGMNKRRVIVVTSPYHQRRARIILSYMGFSDFKIAAMKVSEVYQAENMNQRLRNLRLIVREYLGILKFKIIRK